MGRQSLDASWRLGVIVLQYKVDVAMGKTETETWGTLR